MRGSQQGVLELFAPLHVASVDGPLGRVYIESDGLCITRIGFERMGPERQAERIKVLMEAQFQIDAYLAGKRDRFDLRLAPLGTIFRRAIWAHLQRIPYGGTMSYSDLAADAGTNARNAGAAVAYNPLAIVVPCHRVLSNSGLLHRYQGGLWRKRELLRLEGAYGSKKRYRSRST